VKLGDVANSQAARYGQPLAGVRVLALEQMQALPYATQLLARLGADVVKVEPPGTGESGRGALPAIHDAGGRRVGATFLRNNLNKRSVTANLKDPRGRDLVLRLAAHFDVFAENSKPGTMERLGLGYEAVAAVNPACVYVSISGFGHTASPYTAWPAFAPVVEAMSGIYEMKRVGDAPPVVAPVGALGDNTAALFGTIGILAALMHRERTGEGQHVDIAMFDATIAMTDIVANFWSMGLRNGDLGPLIMHGFRAADGWFVMQVIREHQFARLAELVGCPGWVTDPRFATRQGWVDHLDGVIRPAIETWASTRTRVEACELLASAGVAAGPCFRDEELVRDRHVVARDMLIEIPRTDGGPGPVLTAGNPVKMSKVAVGPERDVPAPGEHTDDVLRTLLALGDDEIADLRAAGAI
jgi:formyl-CoA transferase